MSKKDFDHYIIKIYELYAEKLLLEDKYMNNIKDFAGESDNSGKQEPSSPKFTYKEDPKPEPEQESEIPKHFNEKKSPPKNDREYLPKVSKDLYKAEKEQKTEEYIPQSSEKIFSTNIKDEEQSNDYNQKYQFYEKTEDGQKLKRNEIKIKQNLKRFSKILKKIYKKLLMKLHPDKKVKIPISKKERTQLFQKMRKEYKEKEYAILFYIIHKINYKLSMSSKMIKYLNPFLKTEVHKLTKTNNLMKRSLNSFL